MTERAVTLVLDTSAIVAYTRGSIHVGEVLSEISDEGCAAALPLGCLVEAVPAAADRARLSLLAEHPATTVLGDGSDMWEALAAMADVTGRPDAASAALAAIDFSANVLTGTPLLYAGLGDGGFVIPIGE